MTLSSIDTEPTLGSSAVPGTGVRNFDIEVYTRLEDAEVAWRSLQRKALMLPHQTFEWIAATANAGGCPHDLYIAATFDADGACVFLAPLAFRQHVGLRILEWYCNGQGNYACALFDPAPWNAVDAPSFPDFWQAVLTTLPPVDAVHLGNLPDALERAPNPFLELPHVRSAEPGRSFALNADWREHYEARFSTSSRRELRRCERRLADQGKLKFLRADDPATRSRIYAAMKTQKSGHFERSGINDFFADAAIERFYAALMAMPKTTNGPRLELFALEIGGEIVATNMGLLFQNRFYGLISSTTSGPARRHAPGNVLFRRIVEHLAEAGIELFDCGAGTDAHKLRWCTSVRDRFHAISGLTPRGLIYASALKAQLQLKRTVKESETLWPIAKELRRIKGRASKWFAAGSPLEA